MYQFLNLDNASKAEKEILHTILFKDGHQQRKEFFKDLKPAYEFTPQDLTIVGGGSGKGRELFGFDEFSASQSPGSSSHHRQHHGPGSHGHDADQSDTSSAADTAIESEASMQNELSSSNCLRSQSGGGQQQLRSYYTTAGPVPPQQQNPQQHGGAAGGGQHHPGSMGHHPQLSMYPHPQMMQNPAAAGYLGQPYPVLPVPYPPPPGAPHNIGLPTHLPPQPQHYAAAMSAADVTDIHMHQKIHDMHHSPGATSGGSSSGPGGGQPTSKYRNPKNSRSRRNDNEGGGFHAAPPPHYYPNVSFPPPMYYSSPSVTNMTGTPLIMPGSGAPTPMYHQGPYGQIYPHMMGNENHMQHHAVPPAQAQQQQPPHSHVSSSGVVVNVNQNQQRMESQSPKSPNTPKQDITPSFPQPDLNGPTSSSVNEVEQSQQQQQQQTMSAARNEDAQQEQQRSNINQNQRPQSSEVKTVVPSPQSQPEQKPTMTKPQATEPASRAPGSSPPQQPQSQTVPPRPAAPAGQEALNGSLTDSTTTTNEQQQKEGQLPPTPTEQPTSGSTAPSAEAPDSKPAAVAPAPVVKPKTWSSTVNGGLTASAAASLNSQTQAKNPNPVPTSTPQNLATSSYSVTGATPKIRKEGKTKDPAEFPQLSASSASAMPTSTSTTTVSTAAVSTTSPTPPPPGPPQQPKPLSWASIASRQTANNALPANGTGTQDQKRVMAGAGTAEAQVQHSEHITRPSVNMENSDPSVGLYSPQHDEPICENDTVALRLGEYLANYVLDHHTFSLTPRGLSNQNNFCYINATLQALVACPPFVNLFRSLYDIIGKKPCVSTPIIQSMFDFIMEFEPITRLTQQRHRKTNESFYVGANFEASGIRKVLGLLDGATFKVEGRQQDAEEFLSHLLNALHDEMIKVIKWSESKKEKNAAQSNSKSFTGQAQATTNMSHQKIPASSNPQQRPPQPPPDEDDDNEQWQVMGPKNKGCMTRKTSLSKSPISEMFVGQMCSALNRPNSLKSTTLQPFFTLQLDIQSDNVRTIRDALEGLSIKEEVTGCISSNGLETEAWKQMSLEVLPTILILHMKRFVFDTSMNTIRKLDKRVDFTIDLEIAKDLLSINSKGKYTPKQRQYKLFAVVYHDGEEAIKGHYIADTFHPSGGSLWGQFGWIRYDDTAVKGVGENQILNPQPPRVPYLLYYRRVDTLQTKKDRS